MDLAGRHRDDKFCGRCAECERLCRNVELDWIVGWRRACGVDVEGAVPGGRDEGLGGAVVDDLCGGCSVC